MLSLRPHHHTSSTVGPWGPDEHIGKAITDVLTNLQEDAETGDPVVKKLTPRAFSARISQRDDWKACRHREGSDQCTRLYRTNGCPCDQQSSFE